MTNECINPLIRGGDSKPKGRYVCTEYRNSINPLIRGGDSKTDTIEGTPSRTIVSIL